MATTTLAVLIQRFSEQISDWISVSTTTNITTNNSVISTSLKEYDGAADDYFNDWFCFIDGTNNAAVEREISDYATATGTLTVRGAALAAETGAVTVQMHRYRRTNKTKSINDAIRETSSTLMRDFEDQQLVTGNILPPFNWTSATALSKYSATSATLAKTTAAGFTRNAEASAKVTVSAANGYLSVHSDNYRRLLDLMGWSVTYRCWAYPEVANDATLVIYTLKADATAQTLTSTTTCPAGQWTLLELKNQAINNDIVDIDFRMKVATDTKYVYFDSPRVIAQDIHEYLLPYDFQTGRVSRVYVQYGGYADYACDDLNPKDWIEEFNWSIVNDGTDRFLYLPTWTTERKIRILGRSPLESLSADSDTVTMDAENINALIAYTKYKHFQQFEAPVSSQDVGRYESESAKAYSEYLRLIRKLSSRHRNPSMHLAEI